MPILKSDDETNLFFSVIGKGVPLVLIAGGFCDHHVWSDVIKPLSHVYQVITFDNRGIGESSISTSAYTIELLASDLNRLLIHLDIQSAHIVGHSMGGFIAQYVAAYYPKKILSLSLLSSLLVMNEVGNDYLDRITEGLKNEPEKIRQQMPESAGQQQTISAILQQVMLCKNHDARPYIDKISAPTLIMSGNKEPVVTMHESAMLASAIKTTKHTRLLNCGHMLQRECPDDVVKALLDFLQTLP